MFTFQSKFVYEFGKKSEWKIERENRGKTGTKIYVQNICSKFKAFIIWSVLT